MNILATVLLRTIGTIQLVGIGMMVCRGAIQVKDHVEDKFKQKRVQAEPMSIEDQLDINIHTREIEEHQHDAFRVL